MELAGVEPASHIHLLKCNTTIYGGNGEIRTHGPLSKPSVFKTGAISHALPHFLNFILLELLQSFAVYF